MRPGSWLPQQHECQETRDFFYLLNVALGCLIKLRISLNALTKLNSLLIADVV